MVTQDSTGPRGSRMCAFAAAMAAGLILAGCGGLGGDPIPRDQAQGLLDQIAAAEAAFRANECTTTLPAVIDELHAQAEALPQSVGETRQALIDGIDRLDVLAADDCDFAAPVVPTTPTETVTEETETQETITEETIPTEETTPTEETETEPETETEETIPEKVPPGQTKTKPVKPPKAPKPPKGGQGFVGEDLDD